MKKNDTLIELLAGIIFFGAIIQSICIFALKDHLYHAIGLWSGIIVACFMAIHMQRSIEDALDLGPDDAEKHVRNAYAIRTVVTLVVIGVVICFKLGNPITLVIGIFPLKLSAYLQPFTHKLFLWFRGQKTKK